MTFVDDHIDKPARDAASIMLNKNELLRALERLDIRATRRRRTLAHKTSALSAHGGLDLAGLDDATIRMPYYKGKRITGRVTRARIVTDRRDKTWEWGYYVCVQLDRGQTPDAVNFLYFAHCASLLVKAGQRVASGDALAVMGNTGNAALADPPYRHCHLEVRATAGGVGLDPTVYAGCENAVGVYGAAGRMQVITVGPVTQGDADAVLEVCRARGLVDAGLYRSEWRDA